MHNLFDYNAILHEGDNFTKEGLQASKVDSCDKLTASLASVLRQIMKEESVNEQELALHELCLRSDICKPLLNLSYLK